MSVRIAARQLREIIVGSMGFISVQLGGPKRDKHTNAN